MLDRCGCLNSHLQYLVFSTIPDISISFVLKKSTEGQAGLMKIAKTVINQNIATF